MNTTAWGIRNECPSLEKTMSTQRKLPPKFELGQLVWFCRDKTENRSAKNTGENWKASVVGREWFDYWGYRIKLLNTGHHIETSEDTLEAWKPD